jgi:periplasmic protein CpxP/Spy
MDKVCLLFLTVLLLLGLTIAQGGTSGTHPPNADDQLKQINSMLSLTQEQQIKLRPILQERIQKRVAIIDDSTLSQKDKREKLLALQKSTVSRIRAILTDGQKSHYDSIEQKLRNNQRDHE